MWMNGSRSFRWTPANARRTGKPSPSKPDGAVVILTTGRSPSDAGSVTRGRTRRLSTVTAGMRHASLSKSDQVRYPPPGSLLREHYLNIQHSVEAREGGG